ncbi:hypothetical protein BRD00_09325 [Halobacteriales archaeon QS_8_69_26]|nr:MAG: hypothetical protein BRD00_09325 [Halobacteriales archaeon QS_8_69_26]
MDRISALRNVEDALGEFEAGEIPYEELERRVQAVLRTYATEFDAGSKAAYRVGDDRTVVVVADSPGAARDRAEDLADVSGSVERVSPADRPE